jgi:hypothetical protein
LSPRNATSVLGGCGWHELRVVCEVRASSCRCFGPAWAARAAVGPLGARVRLRLEDCLLGALICSPVLWFPLIDRKASQCTTRLDNQGTRSVTDHVSIYGIGEPPRACTLDHVVSGSLNPKRESCVCFSVGPGVPPGKTVDPQMCAGPELAERTFQNTAQTNGAAPGGDAMTWVWDARGAIEATHINKRKKNPWPRIIRRSPAARRRPAASLLW